MNEAERDTRADHGPTLFLMVGLPGSGKTFRARKLAAERGALRLTPDEWALTLFGRQDRHQEPGGKRWLLEGRLVALAIDTLRLRLNVVLDFGFWSRDERSALRWMAASVGATCEIVYLPVERDVQWNRIQDRWKHTPEQTFPMAEAELDPWREQFEIPGADELSGSPPPSPPPGEESWFDWAQRFWPSLAQSLNGELIGHSGELRAAD
ncbi:AAA family ATPase [Paractinoplanes maris]|uniref:AAA family ATPase n=1 Tax=Paractinoplanes maris TaxID=1734446 RepID=UPI002021A064|nr:ATP-binding protein [Actinoplanes maris]